MKVNKQMNKKTKNKQTSELYPRLAQLGIEINESDAGPPGVNNDSLNAALIRNNLGIETFSELFGCQTCGANGMYPWDVEAVLERMMSGKLTGTQLLWD